MPEISIITPAYIDSHEKADWLKDTIQSVQNQTFADWEMVIIDDASPFSLELPDDKRIRTFRTSEQFGPAKCRNTAVALASAEAILPLDADDLLPENTLEAMYNAWITDPTKIIYGNLQRMAESGGVFVKGKVFKLPTYTFDRSLDFQAIMPVSCLHSVECHQKAGGWKSELDYGLEDVEYWISAGKAGFCGVKIDALTLVYRKHNNSRSNNLRVVHRQETNMRNRIIELHNDVYNGRYPMGCCGGRGGYVPPPSQAQKQSAPTSLAEFGAQEKTWVEYTGNRSAGFGIVGAFTGHSYTVRGPGHRLEVHTKDLSRFKRSGRGVDFNINVMPPDGYTPETKRPDEYKYQAPNPTLARIQQLDEVAIQSNITAQASENGYSLDMLDMENLVPALQANNWTVEKIAEATVTQLMEMDNVGIMKAAKLIEKAKELTRA